MTPLIEPFQAEDPQGRSYGVLADDTGRSGIPSGVYEKQEVQVVGAPSGGTFTLGYGSTAEVDTLTPNETLTGGQLQVTFTADGVTYTSAIVAYSASNAELAAALSSAQGPQGQRLSGTVAVSGGPIASAATKFTFPASLGPVTGLTVAATNVTPAAAKHTVVRTTPGVEETTGALPFNATAAEVQTALRALTAIGGTGVTVAGAAGGPYVVTFAGARTGPQPLLLSTSSLTGGTAYFSPTATVVRLQGGVTAQQVTATGSSTAFGAADLAAIEAVAEATEVTGTTPSLTLSLEGSDDGTTWQKIGNAYPAATANGVIGRETFEVEGWAQLRWAWTVTGTTPKFVLTITTAGKLTGNA